MLPVKRASDCPPCLDCGEPWCEECRMHYFECRHPGPHSDLDEYQAEMDREIDLQMQLLSEPGTMN